MKTIACAALIGWVLLSTGGACLAQGAAPASSPSRLDVFGDPLPPGAVARLGTIRLRGTSPSLSAAFDPDGNRFATGHEGGEICIWDRPTGRPLRRLVGHTGAVTCLVYVAPGRLVSGSLDRTLRWWDGNDVPRITAETESPVTAMTLGPKGKTVLVACGRTIQHYGADTGGKVDEFRLEKVLATSLAVVPRDERIFLGGQDGNVHMLHASARAELGLIEGNPKGPALVASSPDGRYLAWSAENAKIRLADVSTGAQLVALLGHTQPATALAFDAEGRRLASRSPDGTVRLWDPRTGRELWQAPSPGAGGASLAFSPDGRLLAATRSDHAVDLLDTASGRSALDLPAGAAPVEALAVSPDGNRLATWPAGTGSAPRQIPRVWDLAAMREATHPPRLSGRQAATRRAEPVVGAPAAGPGGWPGGVRPAALAEERAARLARAAEDNPPLAAILSAGAKTDTRPASGATRAAVGASPWSADLSLDGSLLVTAGADGKVCLWRARTGERLATFAGHAGPARAVAFLPDGRRFASAGADTQVLLWSVDELRKP